MSFQAPRGTQDILPEEMGRWRQVEELARSVFARAGYREIRTPLLEDARLFQRSTGATTDIVEKEMYTFERESGESVSLRPEGTPSVVRAYLEHSLHKQRRFRKFYYIGPMFRYERPQAGRLRQFHHLGIEALGSDDPLLDVETITVAQQLFDSLGIEGYQVKLNSIGCLECRAEYRKVIRDRLSRHKSELCDNCKDKLERNVFRILDCKNPTCRELVATLPTMDTYLCDGCADHFAQVQAGLKLAGLDFIRAPHLVRGLDYYTRTVYEFTHQALGARDAICGGGRFDGLVEELGGPRIPGVGFAVGLEATLMVLDRQGTKETSVASSIDAFIVTVNDEARAPAFKLLLELRGAGVSCDLGYEGRSLKAQMRQAGRLEVPYVIVIGPAELEGQTVTLRTMAAGEESKVKRSEIVNHLRRLTSTSRLRTSTLDRKD